LPEVCCDDDSRVSVKVAVDQVTTAGSSQPDQNYPNSITPTEEPTFSTLSTLNVTLPAPITALRKVYSPMVLMF
jgi:hypothetical protein